VKALCRRNSILLSGCLDTPYTCLVVDNLWIAVDNYAVRHEGQGSCPPPYPPMKSTSTPTPTAGDSLALVSGCGATRARQGACQDNSLAGSPHGAHHQRRMNSEERRRPRIVRAGAARSWRSQRSELTEREPARASLSMRDSELSAENIFRALHVVTRRLIPQRESFADRLQHGHDLRERQILQPHRPAPLERHEDHGVYRLHGSAAIHRSERLMTFHEGQDATYPRAGE